MMSRAITLLSVSVVMSALIATSTLAHTLQNGAPSAAEAYTSIDPYGAYSVTRWDGKVVGADPDVNVRFQLMRDGFANEN